MELKKHTLIILLLVGIYFWSTAFGFASFITNDCCEQPNNNHCSGMLDGSCKSCAKMSSSHCESGFECTECSSSEPSVAYEVVYEHLNKIQLKKSGLASLSIVFTMPDFNHYAEYKLNPQSDNPYYFGLYLYRSPPFIHA
jgi:hypothetical protein